MSSKTKITFPDIITLNVGGHYYVTKRTTLTKDGDSMLAVMFSGRHNIDQDSEGRYFIDRDGAYFGYILNFLRDNLEMPPMSVALQVYKEAQFYQIRSLIEKLERNAQVFALKLDEAKKTKLGNTFTEWKNAILSKAQLKSLNNLSSSSKINMFSLDDHKALLNRSSCLGEMEHSITLEIDKNLESKDQSFESARKCPDILVDIPQSNMGVFVRTLREQLTREGYSFNIRARQLRCCNTNKIMNVCVEECGFKIFEYIVEFEWLVPSENDDLGVQTEKYKDRQGN